MSRSGNMPKGLYHNWQFAIHLPATAQTRVNRFDLPGPRLRQADVALFRKGTRPGPDRAVAVRWDGHGIAHPPELAAAGNEQAGAQSACISATTHWTSCRVRRIVRN